MIGSVTADADTFPFGNEINTQPLFLSNWSLSFRMSEVSKCLAINISRRKQFFCFYLSQIPRVVYVDSNRKRRSQSYKKWTKNVFPFLPCPMPQLRSVLILSLRTWSYNTLTSKLINAIHCDELANLPLFSSTPWANEYPFRGLYSNESIENQS